MNIIYGQPGLMCFLKRYFHALIGSKGTKEKIANKHINGVQQKGGKNKTGVPLRGTERHTLPNRSSEM